MRHLGALRLRLSIGLAQQGSPALGQNLEFIGGRPRDRRIRRLRQLQRHRKHRVDDLDISFHFVAMMTRQKRMRKEKFAFRRNFAKMKA